MCNLAPSTKPSALYGLMEDDLLPSSQWWIETLVWVNIIAYQFLSFQAVFNRVIFWYLPHLTSIAFQKHHSSQRPSRGGGVAIARTSRLGALPLPESRWEKHDVLANEGILNITEPKTCDNSLRGGPWLASTTPISWWSYTKGVFRWPCMKMGWEELMGSNL